MQLFFGKYQEKDKIHLDEEEARHCIKVLRKKPGEEIEVVDGEGNWFRCEIIEADIKKFEAKVKIWKKQFGKRNFQLTIGIAPPKNIARFEWFLEKATEIGIDQILPVITSRTERTKLKSERLNKILISAMKQSGKAYLPELTEAIPFEKIFQIQLENTQKFIATCGQEAVINLKDVYKKSSDAFILIGPEGDFMDEEVRLAAANGFKPISLGSSRLRVETAGVVACHTVNLMNE